MTSRGRPCGSGLTGASRLRGRGLGRRCGGSGRCSCGRRRRNDGWGGRHRSGDGAGDSIDDQDVDVDNIDIDDGRLEVHSHGSIVAIWDHSAGLDWIDVDDSRRWVVDDGRNGVGNGCDEWSGCWGYRAVTALSHRDGDRCAAAGTCNGCGEGDVGDIVGRDQI